MDNICLRLAIYAVLIHLVLDSYSHRMQFAVLGVWPLFPSKNIQINSFKCKQCLQCFEFL